MFNLEPAIAEWRTHMLAVGIKTPVPLEEVEIHLREEIEQSVQSGQDEESAFHSAVLKIGPAQALRNEFVKVEETKKGRTWKLLENYFFMTALGMPLLVGSMAYGFKNDSFSDMTPSQQLSSLAAAVTFSLLAWGLRLSSGRFPVMHTNRIRDAVFVPVVLWLVAFAYIIMPHGDFTQSQRAVVSLWGTAPLGILVGWLWGFAAAMRQKDYPPAVEIAAL